MERDDIERLLSEILVPVSPNDTFLRRLRARLVYYQGRNALNPWTIVVVIATMVFVLVAGLGLFLRVIVGWIGLLGLLDQSRKQNSNTEPISLG
jgi:hypothetical protein